MLRSPSGRTLVVDAGGPARALRQGERSWRPFLWRRACAASTPRPHPRPPRPRRAACPSCCALPRRRGLGGPAPRRGPGLRSASMRRCARPGVAPRRGGARAAASTGTACGSTSSGRRPRRRAAAARRATTTPWSSRPLRRGAPAPHGRRRGAGGARPRPAACAVLKVPHHGSRTSSSDALLAAVRPRLAIVSAGARNPFGHPHPEVVERYRRAGRPGPADRPGRQRRRLHRRPAGLGADVRERGRNGASADRRGTCATIRGLRPAAGTARRHAPRGATCRRPGDR